MKIHCDECNKYLGEYMFGKGGAEEIAHIKIRYITVADYGKSCHLQYGRKIGTREIPSNSFPDTICFDCIKNPENKLRQDFQRRKAYERTMMKIKRDEARK